MKPLTVVSLPRSGTHFLMRALQLNLARFTGHRPTDIVTTDWLGELGGPEMLHKCHAFPGDAPHVARSSRVLLLRRAFPDWLEAVNAYHQEIGDEALPFCRTALELADRPARLDMFPGRDHYQAPTMREAWVRHRAMWRAVCEKDQLLEVSYEDLWWDLGGTMSRIAGWLGEGLPWTVVRPAMCGHVPRRGVPGRGYGYMTDDDLRELRRKLDGSPVNVLLVEDEKVETTEES